MKRNAELRDFRELEKTMYAVIKLMRLELLKWENLHLKGDGIYKQIDAAMSEFAQIRNLGYENWCKRKDEIIAGAAPEEGELEEDDWWRGSYE